MDPPAREQRSQSAAIVSAVTGTFALSAVVGTIPVGATLMITGFVLFNVSFPLEILLHHPRRNSDNLNAVRDVSGDYRPRADHRACANGEMVDYHRSHSNVAALSDRARTRDVGARH